MAISHEFLLYVFHILNIFIVLFFLEYLVNITEIETEGVEDGTTDLWIQSYYVSISNSSAETSFVNYMEEGKTRIVSTGFSNLQWQNLLSGNLAVGSRIKQTIGHCLPLALIDLSGVFQPICRNSTNNYDRVSIGLVRRL